MSGGAYNIQPERRFRHLTDVLTKGPRSFDAVVIGAGTRPETVEAAQASFGRSLDVDGCVSCPASVLVPTVAPLISQVSSG